MTMTDPIADLFTRIRNAGSAGHSRTDIPHSTMKEAVLKVLVREGYVKEMQVTEYEGRKRIRAYIKRDLDGKHIISAIERVSKPGRRVYRTSRDIKSVLRGMGTGIYSTSKGVLTDRECREKRVGGEYIGKVW